jgi:hypothetical protein
MHLNAGGFRAEAPTRCGPFRLHPFGEFPREIISAKHPLGGDATSLRNAPRSRHARDEGPIPCADQERLAGDLPSMKITRQILEVRARLRRNAEARNSIDGSNRRR